MTTSIEKFVNILKIKWVLTTLCLVLIAGAYVMLRGGSSPYQFITVTQGSVTETVSVTGNTTPSKNVSLGFQNTGMIARVNYGLGQQVNAGNVIAELNTGSLSAALQQAQANLAVAQANLDALTAGTRPEQLSLDQSTVRNAVTNAYTLSDSAVHTETDQFFTNPRNSTAALSFIVPDAMLTSTIVQERIALEPLLTAWNMQLSSVSFTTNDPTAPATQAVQNLSKINTFLNNVATALTKTTSVSGTTLTTYQSNVSSARANIAAALTTLSNAQGALTLAEAGSTSQSIAAQQAQVDQAKAGVASAEANLRGSEILAPISGVITQQDAKIGQLATPGTPLVSIIGNGGFEVDAGVSETDVGKVMMGDKVSMTLDAFPNETFAGSVFYIAPAQTNTQGVISYQIKISFDKADPRLKSGLTANIDIQTQRHDNVLILPQYAILQNDNGTFVQTLIGKTATTSPVTLGIQDQKGNVEILSGVSLGEQVINIGLKAQ